MEYTRCFSCAEPTRRVLSQTSNFGTDNGLVFECDADCSSPEKEHSNAVKATLEAFRNGKIKQHRRVDPLKNLFLTTIKTGF